MSVRRRAALLISLPHSTEMFILFHFDGFLFISGYEWIGWRNDTPGLLGKPVEIVFEFDTVRNFSAIVLHTNNMFTKDVQVST